VLAALVLQPWRRHEDDHAGNNVTANNPAAPSAPAEKSPPTPTPASPPTPQPVAENHEIRRFTGKGQMRTMALSPDNKRVYAGGYAGKIHVWDLDSGAELRTIALDGSVSKLRMSGDGARLAVTSPFTLWVFDPHTGAQLVKLLLSASIHDMAFLPDQRHLLCVFFGPGTAQKNRKIGAEFDYQGLNIIDTVTGKMARTLRLDEPHFFRSVACSPDGKWFAAGSDDGSAFLVNAAEGKQTRAFKMTFGACFAVAFSRDSQRLFASDNGSHLRAWRVSDGTLVSAGTFPHLFTRFYLSPDETWLALNDAQECDLYDLTTRFGQAAAPLPRHESKIADVAFLSSGDQILTCSWDGTVRLWKMPPRVHPKSP
jgi:WD40 repeat protein